MPPFAAMPSAAKYATPDDDTYGNAHERRGGQKKVESAGECQLPSLLATFRVMRVTPPYARFRRGERCR